MKDLEKILNSMEPAAALAALAPPLKNILVHLEEEARVKFVTDMINAPGEDKVSSLVHL